MVIISNLSAINLIMLMVVWIKVCQCSGSKKLENGQQQVVLTYNIGWQTALKFSKVVKMHPEITVTDGTLTISLGDGSLVTSQSTVSRWCSWWIMLLCI